MSTLDDFAIYWRKVTKRLKRGQEDYGDASFVASPVELLEEIQQELEDISGWGYILWRRLERAKARLQQQESKGFFNECDEEDGDD